MSFVSFNNTANDGKENIIEFLLINQKMKETTQPNDKLLFM